ncbi:MAG: hypothetical protein ND866_32435 [Pyrinomonadaceae bacterium]|nr:hypothetical protein [Pyrinomonadaceae bacterium]
MARHLPTRVDTGCQSAVGGRPRSDIFEDAILVDERVGLFGYLWKRRGGIGIAGHLTAVVNTMGPAVSASQRT